MERALCKCGISNPSTTAADLLACMRVVITLMKFSDHFYSAAFGSFHIENKKEPRGKGALTTNKLV